MEYRSRDLRVSEELALGYVLSHPTCWAGRGLPGLLSTPRVTGQQRSRRAQARGGGAAGPELAPRAEAPPTGVQGPGRKSEVRQQKCHQHLRDSQVSAFDFKNNFQF